MSGEEPGDLILDEEDNTDLDEESEEASSDTESDQEQETTPRNEPMGRDRLWALLPSDVVVPQRMDPEQRLFRHATHPEWGVGLWVKEERTRRRLRFEDGEQRAFKKGFYHFLRPVDPDNVDVDEVFYAIRGEHQVAQAEQVELQQKVHKAPVMSLDEQIDVFQALYPEGFEDPAYVEHHRRPAGAHRRKTQVEPAMAIARERLGHDRISGLLANGGASEVHADTVEVMTRTSLIKPSCVKEYAAIDASAHEALAIALDDLLHGTEGTRLRVGRWVDALRACGLDPGWPLATALLALMDPTAEVLVQARVLSLQARAVRPEIAIARRPTPRGYRKGRRVMKAVAERLTAAGMPPADMLDVRMFAWETLRPKGQELGKKLRGGSR